MQEAVTSVRRSWSVGFKKPRTLLLLLLQRIKVIKNRIIVKVLLLFLRMSCWEDEEEIAKHFPDLIDGL